MKSPIESARTRHRRLTVIVASGLVAVLLAAAAWWFLWVPNIRPSLQAGEVHAIDVSRHQGEIGWSLVSADGISAAMIKATEGNDYKDPRFDENWTESAEAGLARGAYHFFTLCSPGADQADNFLAAAPPEDSALPPAIDLELIGACEARPPQSVVSDELEEFQNTVEEAWGRPLLVYARDDFTSEYDIGALAGNPQWDTHFFVRPGHDEWTMWQIHYFARVDGIDGRVDLDVLRPED